MKFLSRKASLRHPMVWHHIRLTREEVEEGEVDVIRGVFMQLYFVRNAPSGMALLGEPEAGGYSLYLTPPSIPHAQVIIRIYSAVPGEPPRARRLTLIAGDPAAEGYMQAF